MPLSPKPEPLAIIPSRRPIAEVLERRQEVYKQYPTATETTSRARAVPQAVSTAAAP